MKDKDFTFPKNKNGKRVASILIKCPAIFPSPIRRIPAYENEMCKVVGLRCSCNGCDRIIFEDENWMENYAENAGYCKECSQD